METEFNFKNFSIHQLKGLVPHDAGVICSQLKSFKDGDFFTISDCASIWIERGSENLYLTIDIYPINPAEERDEFKPIALRIYTKDNHEGLKQIIKLLTDQI